MLRSLQRGTQCLHIHISNNSCLTGNSMLWLSMGMGGLMGVAPLLRYQAVPTATAPRASRVDGSERKLTRELEPEGSL